MEYPSKTRSHDLTEQPPSARERFDECPVFIGILRDTESPTVGLAKPTIRWGLDRLPIHDIVASCLTVQIPS